MANDKKFVVKNGLTAGAVPVIDSNGNWIGPNSGLIGYTGSQGVIGYTGSQGVIGYTGSQGVIGYTGSQGVIGYTGSRGYTGSQGVIGYTGSQGIQGVIGYTGSQGIQGVIGYTGSQGVIGYTGSRGIQGVIGYTGSKGDQGVIGYTGSQGIQGVIGYTGSQGIQGVIGYTGSQGIQGVIGYTGSQGVIGYTGSRGYTGSQGVIGYTGSQGIQGVIGYTGSQGVIGYTGSTGDKGGVKYSFTTSITDADPGNGVIAYNNATIASVTNLFVDIVDAAGVTQSAWFDSWDDSTNGTDRGYIYVTGNVAGSTVVNIFRVTGAVTNATTYYKIPVAYVSGVLPANATVIQVGFSRTGNLGYTGSQGVIGYTGSQGIQGVIGYTGSQGVQGVIGYSGSQGYTGSRGYTGSQGIQGVIGYTGSQGIQGVIGYTGSQGIQGVIGYTGSQGIQGVIGYTGSQGIQGVIGYTGSQGVIGYTGSRGYTGSQGVIGYTGSQGIQGVIGYSGSRGSDGNFGGATFDYTFDNGVTAADPGTGKLRFNNATLASATALYIDAANDAATDITTFLNTIDDSSSTIKGHFRVSKKFDPATFALFTISSLTNNTSWFSVVCSYVSGSGTFANTDDIIITFARTGDRGDIGYTGSQGVIGYTGSRGYTGSQGVIGYTGSQGYTGSRGYTGSQGIQGVIGYTGSQGIQGVIGYTGSQGIQGVIGYTGSQGIQGVIGYTGSQGIQGVIGYTGSRGVIGYTGSQGVIGYTGSQGVIGYTGSQGDRGGVPFLFSTTTTDADPGNGIFRYNNAAIASVTFIYIDLLDAMGNTQSAWFDSWDDSTNNAVKGLLTMTSATAAGTSVNVFRITGTVTVAAGYYKIPVTYVSGALPTNNAAMSFSFSRVGDQGYTGSQGVIGYTGSQGVIGYTGSQGVIGYTGSQGVIGYTGSRGYTGSQGVIGYTGSQGVIGYTGSQGIQGVIGYTGSQGNLGGAPYVFSTTVTDADPGNGAVRYNNAAIASVTFIYIDNLDNFGNTQTAWYDTWDDSTNTLKGFLTIMSAVPGSTTVNVFRITGAVTVATGYYKVPVTYVSGALPTNAAVMTVAFARSGDLGYTGSQGVIGYTGSQGVIGYTGSQGVIGYTGSRGYTGSQGVIGYTGSQGVIGYTGSTGFRAQTQSTAPTGSNTGDIWFDTETGMIKIYYNDGDSAQWVTATGTRGNLGYSGSRGYTGSSGLPTWTLKTANYTAQVLDYILADTTAGSFTITLPASPVIGSTVTILDKYNWTINNLIVARNGKTIEGIADDFIIDIGQARIEFTYDGTTWQIYSSIGSKGYTGSSGSSSEAIALAIALG